MIYCKYKYMYNRTAMTVNAVKQHILNSILNIYNSTVSNISSIFLTEPVFIPLLFMYDSIFI